MAKPFFSDTPGRSAISAQGTELEWLQKKWGTFIAPGDRVLSLAHQKAGKSALATQTVKVILQKEPDWGVLWAFNDGPEGDCNSQVASIFGDKSVIENHILHFESDSSDLEALYKEYSSIKEKHPEAHFIVVIDTLTNIVQPGSKKDDPVLSSFLKDIASNKDILLGTAHLWKGSKAREGIIRGVQALKNETNVHISIEAKDVNNPIRSIGITGRGVPSIQIDNLAIDETGIHPAKFNAAGAMIAAKKVLKTYREVRPLITLAKDVNRFVKFLTK